MAKQTPTIKNPSQQDAIAKAKAGKSMKSELAQGARKPLSQEELDKLNAKAVDAQQADIVADASASGAAQTAEAGTIGSASEAGAAAGTISPLAIGAGVLGVVAIAAASGGSSGGSGSSHNSGSNQALADGSKPNQNTQDQGKGSNTVTDAGAGGTGGTGAGTGGTGSAGAGGTGGTGAGTGTTEPGKQDPVPPQYGQATAEGTPKAPTVSPDGETKLSASRAAFAEKLTEAGKTEASQQFIRIDRILAAEGSEPEARLVRYPENDAQGVAVKPKAPDAAAAAPSQLTAYEVIKVEGGITLADAKAAAEKLGGKLMMVNDAAEAKWLDDAFKNFLGENTGAADLAKNGAWIGGHAVAGDGKFDAAIRAEGEQATKIHYFDHSGEKLSAFVVEFDNYQHPLTLDGKPVAEGQVINAEDFDKLVWNANANQGGKIKFSVVDSAEATEPGKIEGDLVITESAAVTRPILNAGTGGNTTPDAGNNTPADPNAGSNTNDQPGNSGSTGGSAGSNSTPAKPLPVYPENNARTLSVTENKADAKLDKSVFTGTDEAKAPEFVKILTVDLPGLASDIGDKTALFITHSDRVENITNDTPEFILHKSLFDKISWNASLANGGSFTFVPVADDKGTAIPGAKTQTVTINETPAAPANPADGQQTPGSEQQPPGNGQQQPGGQQNQDGNPQGSGGSQQNPDGGQQGPGGSPSSPDAGGQAQTDGQQEPQKAAPEYSKEALSVEVTHNNEAHNFESAKAMFEGNGTKATHVKITEIKKNGSDAADEGTLKYNGQPVTETTVIELTQLNKLVWDASKAEGGSFKFTAVQSDGKPFATPAVTQTVTINEAAAPQQPAAQVPAYEADQKVHVAHDGNKTFDKAVFEGTNEQAKTKFIEITEIKNGAGEDAVAETLMKGTSALTVGAKVAATEFDSIKWDASKNEGGSFSFKPVSDDNGTEIPGAPTQKITIVEHNAVPTYAEDNKTIAVAHDQVASIDKAAVAGTGTEAAFIKITEINGSTDATSASEQLKTNGTGVKVGQTLNADEMSKLTWDTSAVDGGSFKFQPAHDAAGTLLEGSAVKTITIDEHRAAPQYNAEALKKTVTTDQELTFGAEFFQGTQTDAHPPFIKITEIKNGAGQDAAASTLMKGTQPISVNDVIEATEFGNIKWDASKNENGSFKFVSVLDKDGAKAHLGATEQTVTITETAAPSAQDNASDDTQRSESSSVSGSEPEAKVDGEAGSKPNNEPSGGQSSQPVGDTQAVGNTTAMLKSLIDIDQSYPI